MERWTSAENIFARKRERPSGPTPRNPVEDPRRYSQDQERQERPDLLGAVEDHGQHAIWRGASAPAPPLHMRGAGLRKREEVEVSMA